MPAVLEVLASRYPDLVPTISAVRAAFDLIAVTYRGGGTLLVCGNGGSAADCEHIVGELMKGYTLKRPLDRELRGELERTFGKEGAYLAGNLQGALPAISLVSQTSLQTALANDVAADLFFAQQVYGYGRPGDTLLGISTSGNAKNVLYALRIARARGLHTVGLTGPTGGAMSGLCDVAICVPGHSTAAIQERHLPVYHALCEMLEREFFSE